MRQPRRKRQVYEYPWLDPKLRDDVTHCFNLRLNEPYLHKLRYISEKNRSSMQQFCQTILTKAIDQEIESIIQKSS
jgi:hypothetical protein